jgi:predicted phage tail protein
LGATTLDPSPPDCAPEASAVAPGTVTCRLVLSPLPGRDGRLRTHDETFPAGDPLDAYLPDGEDLARVVLNGGIVLPEHYGNVCTQPGDEVWLWPAWGGPEVWIPALIGLAVGLLSATAQHFLFRPKPLLLPAQPQMTGETERTFSFEGIRTAIGPGSVVPVVYGRHRIGGQLLLAAVDHVATVIDDGVVPPTVTITNITYGQPADIVYVTAPAHGLHDHQNIRIEGVQGKTGLNKGWTIIPVDSDTIILLSSWGQDFNAPYLGGGTIMPDNLGSRAYQAVSNPPTLSLMLALCEGPIDAILTNTIQINGQPLANFPGVQVYTGLGAANQPAIAEFGGARNTFSDGREIQGVLTYTSNDVLTAFVLNLTFLEGLFFLDNKGEKHSNAVTLQYRYALTGTGAWSAWLPFQVGADRPATVRIGIRRENLPLARYDIQIEFVHVINNDELHAKYRPTLESVTEFLPNTYVYPYTALLGLKALATEALRGALPNITVEVRGRTVRVGTFNPTETWSENPAWCVMDMLTNTRYGRGVPDTEIDLPSFSVYEAACAQVIDGESRHTLNYVLDRETRAQQVFLETMGGSRGMLLKSAGQWHARPTRPETPTCLLTWASVANLRLTYLRDAEGVNVLEARFANEAKDYEQDVLSWPPLDQRPPEYHQQSLDLRGITKESRVIRALQFELNRRRFENVLLEMDCAYEAVPLQLHDLFRFSHPLPGWGVSGRILAGSTAAVLQVDEDCVIESGHQYCVYVRHEDDSVEFRYLVNTVLGTVRTLYMFTALQQQPTPRTSTWVFGEVAADTVSDASTRTFRVTALQRRSDTTVHVEAVIHNPSIYDEVVGTPLPVITTLFNPLGPPPPLTTLVATEVTRVQTSGTSLRAVNLSWDVAALSTDYAPYGGATILRRTLLVTGQAGQAQAGVTEVGAISDPNDPNINYAYLTQVRGHVLDYDDYTVLTGATYQYRVVPIAATGVPNNPGAREVVIHIAGPTTPDFFPGTVANLRLKGQPVGVLTWEGRDLHVEWDRVPPSPLFNETFFVQQYVVGIWAPGQLYHLHSFAVPLQPTGTSAQFTYTYQQNEEDQVRSGFPTARRELQVMVWAVTNTGAQSLTPASLVFSNPPPDMSVINLTVTPLADTAIADWSQWRAPRDIASYAVYLDIMDPPQTLYQTLDGGNTLAYLLGLTPGVIYYVVIWPFDTFGPGIPTLSESFVPIGVAGLFLETDPPAVPTGLSLTTGSDVSQDGTIVPWVEAHWAHNTETDLGGYQLSFRIEPSAGSAPTVVHAGPSDTSYRLNVPGNLTIFCKIAAEDRLKNISEYSAEVSITAGGDTVPPGPCSNLTIIGSTQKVHLLWTPSINAPDYAYAEVWASAINNRANAGIVGQGAFSYEHAGFTANQTVYFWVRSVDTSGNRGAFHPLSATAGVPGTAGQLDTTFISSLAANKIIAGTITALVKIGVSGLIDLDGPNQVITIKESQTGNARVFMGRLGTLGTDWGLMVLDAAGRIMFDARTGGVTAFGISTGVINAGHITTSTAVITTAAQIATAIITNAHIQTVEAGKITVGTITSQVGIANSNTMVLDGGNNQFRIRDLDGNLRVLLGLIDFTSTGYGMRIFNASGQIMYDFTTGATEFGITDLAVTSAKIQDASITSAKIQTAAIQNAHIGNLEVDNAKIAELTVGTSKIQDNAITNSVQYVDNTTLTVSTAETAAASLVFAVNPGDQVVMWATATGVVTGGTLTIRIREDSTTGNELAYGEMNGTFAQTMVTQAVYTATGSGTKAFVFTFRNQTTGDPVALHHRKFVGIRRQK